LDEKNIKDHKEICTEIFSFKKKKREKGRKKNREKNREKR